MLSGWVILVSAFAYVLLLFAVASYGDGEAVSPACRRTGGLSSMR